LLWFPRPLEIASDETQKLLNDLGRSQLPRLRGMALQAQAEATRPGADFLQQVFAKGADAVWILDRDGKVIRAASSVMARRRIAAARFACSQMFQGSIAIVAEWSGSLGGR